MEVYKPNGSEYWHYDFRINGKRYRKSTKQKNEKRAKKVAADEFARIQARLLSGREPAPKRVPGFNEFSTTFEGWVDKGRLAAASRR